MTDQIKYMNITEFREAGYLQEINRQFLHPLGLALEVQSNGDGTEHLGGIWDYRDDPEGITFDGIGLDPEKKARVDLERAKHAPHRMKLLGSVVQPVRASDG